MVPFMRSYADSKGDSHFGAQRAAPGAQVEKPYAKAIANRLETSLGPEERIVAAFRTSSIKPQMDLFWQGCVRLADGWGTSASPSA